MFGRSKRGFSSALRPSIGASFFLLHYSRKEYIIGNMAKSTRFDLSMEGEAFDISNLLESLPDDEGEEPMNDDSDLFTNYASCRSTGSSSNDNNKNSSSSSTMNTGRSLGRVASSIRGIKYPTRDSVIRCEKSESFNGEESIVLGEDYRYLAAGFTQNLAKRQSSVSGYQDVPGLADLNESISSFTENEDELDIEISPGIYLPFRGSDDTWKAIKAGNYKTIQCFDCQLEMVCAKDCEYVICPNKECHTLNPLDNTNGKSVHFGVLMGFRKEWCGEYYKGDTRKAE